MSEQQILEKFARQMHFFKTLAQFLARYPAENKQIAGDLSETLSFLLLRFFLYNAKTNWKDDVLTFEYIYKLSEYQMSKYNDNEVYKQLFVVSKQISKMEVNDKISYFIREQLLQGNIQLLFKVIDGPPQLILKYYQTDSYMMTNAKTKELTEILQGFRGIAFKLEPDLSIPQQQKNSYKLYYFYDKIRAAVPVRSYEELMLEQEGGAFDGLLVDESALYAHISPRINQALAMNDNWFTEIAEYNPLLRSAPPKPDALLTAKTQNKTASKSHTNLHATTNRSMSASENDEKKTIAKMQTCNDLKYLTGANEVESCVANAYNQDSEPSSYSSTSYAYSASYEFYLPTMRAAVIEQSSSNESYESVSENTAIQSAHSTARTEAKKQTMISVKEDFSKAGIVCELFEYAVFSTVEYCYDYFGKYQERLAYTRLYEKGWPERKFPTLEPFENHIINMEPQHLAFPDGEKEIIVSYSKTAGQRDANAYSASSAGGQIGACTTLEAHNFVLIYYSYIGPLSRGIYCPYSFPVPASLQRLFYKYHAVCHSCGQYMEYASDATLATRYCHFRGELVCGACALIPTVLPASLIAGDPSCYGTCAKCASFVEAIFDKPLVLSEALGHSMRSKPQFRVAESLRRRIIMAYKLLSDCDRCDTQISLFLQQEYAKYFKFAPRHQGQIPLSSACLLGDGRDHLGCFEQAVISSSCKSGVDSVVSVGYWSCQDLIDIHSEILAVQFESCIRYIGDHVKSCTTCSRRFARTCACGVMVNVCSNGATLCAKCGTLECAECAGVLYRCYVCGYNE